MEKTITSDQADKLLLATEEVAKLLRILIKEVQRLTHYNRVACELSPRVRQGQTEEAFFKRKTKTVERPRPQISAQWPPKPEVNERSRKPTEKSLAECVEEVKKMCR